MTPIVRGETLTYRQNEQEQELTVGTPAWFAWLETASTFQWRDVLRMSCVASYLR